MQTWAFIDSIWMVMVGNVHCTMISGIYKVCSKPGESSEGIGFMVSARLGSWIKIGKRAMRQNTIF